MAPRTRAAFEQEKREGEGEGWGDERERGGVACVCFLLSRSSCFSHLAKPHKDVVGDGKRGRAQGRPRPDLQGRAPAVEEAARVVGPGDAQGEQRVRPEKEDAPPAQAQHRALAHARRHRRLGRRAPARSLIAGRQGAHISQDAGSVIAQ
jgi:hypothetical protein